MSIEEELIELRLIDCMHNISRRYKMLEQLQLSKLTLNSCVNFIQQELMKKFYLKENQDEIAVTFMMKKMKLKCKELQL